MKAMGADYERFRLKRTSFKLLRQWQLNKENQTQLQPRYIGSFSKRDSQRRKGEEDCKNLPLRATNIQISRPSLPYLETSNDSKAPPSTIWPKSCSFVNTSGDQAFEKV